MLEEALGRGPRAECKARCVDEHSSQAKESRNDATVSSELSRGEGAMQGDLVSPRLPSSASRGRRHDGCGDQVEVYPMETECASRASNDSGGAGLKQVKQQPSVPAVKPCTMLLRQFEEGEDLMSRILKGRLLHVRSMKSLWQKGDLPGLGLFVMNAGDKALCVDFLQHIKSRTLRESQDVFALSAIVLPAAVQLLSSRYEDYVIISLRVLQNTTAVLVPILRKCFTDIATMTMELSANRIVKCNSCINELTDVQCELQKLARRSDLSRTISSRLKKLLKVLSNILSLPQG